MILTSPRIAADDLEPITGWHLEPKGLCRGDVCVPLMQPLVGPDFEIGEIADALGMPVVADEPHGLWSLGPPAGRALQSAVAPDLTLSDWKGEQFSLRSLRGQKVFLLAWASW